MKDAIVEKVLFARELLEFSKDCFHTENPFANAAGIIFLQDSVEIFLLALAEHVGAEIKPKTSFDTYFALIEQRTTNPLPKSQLLKLNKQRVNIKHHAFSPPAIVDCKHFLHSVEDFFEDSSREYFKVQFQSISLIELLDEGEVKEHLKHAEANLKDKNYEDCLVNCRKAIYKQIEWQYSIEAFKKRGASNQPLLFPFSLAPSFTKDKMYIDKYVQEPTDYIVIDETHLNMELLKAGINPQEFWNVWSLTPEVFYEEEKSRWLVKHEFKILEGSNLKENAEYCFWKTANIVLKLQKLRQQIKMPPPSPKFIKLKRKGVYIYEKADRNCGRATELPSKGARVMCDYMTKGLENDDTYYHVVWVDDNYVPGFIHKDDVEKLLDKTEGSS